MGVNFEKEDDLMDLTPKLQSGNFPSNESNHIVISEDWQLIMNSM